MNSPGAPFLPKTTPPGRSGQAPAARHSRFRRVAGGLASLAFSCVALACSSPRDATPLPEPPAMVDTSKVRPEPTFIVTEGSDGGVPLGVVFTGGPGAAPAQ